MDLLERVVEVGGQLLRVDAGSAALVLTFDVGRILVEPDPAAGVAITQVADRDELPEGLADAAEEEPWWRFLGQPVTAVSARDGGGVRLRFRHEADNPRIVAVSSAAGGLRCFVEP